ncbi:hypothetical protein DMC30DRAFT_415321 [Rhodotorula diobovata]|uniref:Uncharacterized protein n=1 Tax=Rhodotorula diobovata TaxID=5288 RepID=A0A5C5FZA5_9BASI|nr:hypothetical protein DMC30DRAFT_415321 [Rhodotorula diobovata]
MATEHAHALYTLDRLVSLLDRSLAPSSSSASASSPPRDSLSRLRLATTITHAHELVNQLSSSSSTSSTSSSPGAQPPKEGPSLASYHATEQATLLTALTALSSTLKSSTLEFSSLLARDREVLSSAEAKLAASEGRMGAEGRRLEGVRRKGRGTTCATVGVLVGVAVLWVLVFLLIKVT